MSQHDYNMANPGITVQKPDGAMAVVGEQLPDTPASWPPGLKWDGPLKFEVVELPPTPEPVHGGPYLLWADIESALSRLGMVPVARSWYHEARALMDERRQGDERLAKNYHQCKCGWYTKRGLGKCLGCSTAIDKEPPGIPFNALRPLHGEKWR